MKKIILAIILFAAIGQSNKLSAQTYSEMPKEVQLKIDQNKAKGVPLSEGIKVDYELTIEGVVDAKSADEFKALLQKECGLSAFRFDSATKHVVFTVPAKYNLEGMKPFVKNSKFGFGNFFKEIYHI